MVNALSGATPDFFSQRILTDLVADIGPPLLPTGTGWAGLLLLLANFSAIGHLALPMTASKPNTETSSRRIWGAATTATAQERLSR